MHARMWRSCVCVVCTRVCVCVRACMCVLRVFRVYIKVYLWRYDWYLSADIEVINIKLILSSMELFMELL